MKRVAVAVMLTALLLVLPSEAKPKKKLFNNTPQEVFDAALRTARERHVVTYVDQRNLMFTFQTGSSALSSGFVANASVLPEVDNKSDLVINVQHREGISVHLSMNAGDRMADKFYDQVSDELARLPRQKSASKPEAEHVQVPPAPGGTETKATDPKAEDAGKVTVVVKPNAGDMGRVTVLSDPLGSEITVDGAFVGNTPATLKLPSGKHRISVGQTGFATYSKEINVLGDSESRLDAVLTKEETAAQKN